MPKETKIAHISDSAWALLSRNRINHKHWRTEYETTFSGMLDDYMALAFSHKDMEFNRDNLLGALLDYMDDMLELAAGDGTPVWWNQDIVEYLIGDIVRQLGALRLEDTLDLSNPELAGRLEAMATTYAELCEQDPSETFTEFDKHILCGFVSRHRAWYRYQELNVDQIQKTDVQWTSEMMKHQENYVKHRLCSFFQFMKEDETKRLRRDEEFKDGQ